MDILKILFVTLVMLIIVRPGFEADREWLLVQYSLPARILTLAMSVFFAVTTYSAFQAEKGPNTIVYGILLTITLVGFVGTVEAFQHKLWFDREKIYYQKPFGRRMVINMNDIISCKIAWFGNEFHLQSADGRKIRISPYMSGGSKFFELIRQRLAINNS